MQDNELTRGRVRRNFHIDSHSTTFAARHVRIAACFRWELHFALPCFSPIQRYLRPAAQ